MLCPRFCCCDAVALSSWLNPAAAAVGPESVLVYGQCHLKLLLSLCVCCCCCWMLWLKPAAAAAAGPESVLVYGQCHLNQPLGGVVP
jgi:hypothetical protein